VSKLKTIIIINVVHGVQNKYKLIRSTYRSCGFSATAEFLLNQLRLLVDLC